MNWLAIYPEIVLLAMACVITLVDLFVDHPLRTPTYLLTQATLAVVAAMHLAVLQRRRHALRHAAHGRDRPARPSARLLRQRSR